MGDDGLHTRRLLRIPAVSNTAPRDKVPLGERVAALEMGRFRETSRFADDPKAVTGVCFFLVSHRHFLFCFCAGVGVRTPPPSAACGVCAASRRTHAHGLS
jgi:hypothetical protein